MGAVAPFVPLGVDSSFSDERADANGVSFLLVAPLSSTDLAAGETFADPDAAEEEALLNEGAREGAPEVLPLTVPLFN